MPVWKTAKRSAPKRKKSTGLAKPAAAVRKVVQNPRRAIRNAEKTVHGTAVRAKKIGGTVTTAGQLIQEAADFVDSIVTQARSRKSKTVSQLPKSQAGSRSRKKR